MVDLCTSCIQRPLCSCLCPEAELYVKQDEKSQRELTIGLPRKGAWPKFVEKSIFTETEIRILDALLDGKTRKQIAKDLGITRENLRQVLYFLHKKRQEKKPIVGEE